VSKHMRLFDVQVTQERNNNPAYGSTQFTFHISARSFRLAAREAIKLANECRNLGTRSKCDFVRNEWEGITEFTEEHVTKMDVIRVGVDINMASL
jgi:hypothetical protein